MPDSLQERFARLESDVVLTGDTISGNEVVECFVCAGGNDIHRRHDSAVVVDSATQRRRTIALEAAREQRTQVAGQRPVLRLPAGRVTVPAKRDFHTRIMARIAAVTVDVWRGGSRAAEPVSDTLGEMAKDGYDIWVIGGLVRDTLRQEVGGVAPVETKGDLDLTGSVPPGHFAEGVREMVGRAELSIRFNPFSGVVAVSHEAAGSDRVLEYASLKGTNLGEGEAWTFSCDLAEDSEWRDLTINTLAYDWRAELIADPTGEGLDDVKTMTLRPPAKPKSRPGFRAHLLFRYLKFVRRWPDASLHAVRRVLQDEFVQFREDVRMLSSPQLKALLKPFGTSQPAQIACVLALGASLAPVCDWDEMFSDVIEGTA